MDKNHFETTTTDATDHEIDRLVYELYGLTEDEIKIVEGESSRHIHGTG